MNIVFVVGLLFLLSMHCAIFNYFVIAVGIFCFIIIFSQQFFHFSLTVIVVVRFFLFLYHVFCCCCCIRCHTLCLIKSLYAFFFFLYFACSNRTLFFSLSLSSFFTSVRMAASVAIKNVKYEKRLLAKCSCCCCCCC